MLNKHLVIEERIAVGVSTLFHQAIFNANAILLAPFDKTALEINQFIGNLVDVDNLRQDTVVDEFHASIIAPIQVNGTDKRFEGIAVYITIVGRIISVRKD